MELKIYQGHIQQGFATGQLKWDPNSYLKLIKIKNVK